MLAHRGRHDLITGTVDDYIDRTVGLAKDLPRLTLLQAILPKRMRRATGMNPLRFPRQLEAAYRWTGRQCCHRVLQPASAR